jgi:hypothetical protein
MKKVILKDCHPSNHRVNVVPQYRQIVDGAKVLQQKSMNNMQYTLHQSIHGTVWRSEKVPVSPTGNLLQKDRVVMDVEIIHCKAE